MLEVKGRYTTAFIMIDEVEQACISQIHRMVSHVAFDNHIAIMPDTHSGNGAVIGFSMPLGTKILPSVVGVDVGCGMLSINIGSGRNINHQRLDDDIRNYIPLGINTHEDEKRPGNLPKFNFKEQFPWDIANDTLKLFVLEYNKKFGTSFTAPTFDYRWFGAKCRQIGIKQDKAELSIGSLGGGNHFIEVSKSESCDDIWITVHSGSRNFGKCVCDYHTKVAKNVLDKKRNVILAEKISDITKNTTDKSKIASLIEQAKKDTGVNFEFDIRGMEFLEGQEAMDYFVDMIFCQAYSSFNRKHMIDIICEVLGGIHGGEQIESIHNYIDFRDFVIRKGAIRSYVGEKMIIPFNMRDGILICEGKSNEFWNNSAPHGAGRLMSRSEAKHKLDLEKFRLQMEGIFSTSVCNGTLDEAPGAYKDCKVIEAAIEPTATIIDRLKPIHNIKDKNSGPSWKERREEKKKDKQRREERNLKQNR